MVFLPDLLDKIDSVPIELVDIPVDTYPPLEALKKNLVDMTLLYDYGYYPEPEEFAKLEGILSLPIGRDKVKIHTKKTNPPCRRRTSTGPRSRSSAGNGSTT